MVISDKARLLLEEVAEELRQQALEQDCGRVAARGVGEAAQLLYDCVRGANSIFLASPADYATELRRIADKIECVERKLAADALRFI